MEIARSVSVNLLRCNCYWLMSSPGSYIAGGMLDHKFLRCLLKDRLLWLVNPTFHTCDDCLTLLRFNGFFK